MKKLSKVFLIGLAFLIMLTNVAEASSVKDKSVALCTHISKDFMSKRPQLSNMQVESAVKFTDSFYTCHVRYDVKTVHATMPAGVNFEMNPNGAYSFKQIY
tara:strand:+ start:815 stop:1117 length:303 start_codon:yes stop_codon:yes gene_type:complete